MKRYFRPLVFFMTVVLAACASLAALSLLSEHPEEKGAVEKDLISCISFSPDGKKLLFNRRKDGAQNLIHVYDLETGDLAAYQPPAGEKWAMARYSADGESIVFSVFPEDPLQTGRMQVAIMDPDGENVRKITTSDGPKINPVFSRSGNRIIFAKGKMRENGRTFAAGFDFYEVDVKTGTETRLTWFNLYSVSPPCEFPDGKTLIFGAFGFPGREHGADNADNVYLAKKGERGFPRPLVTLGDANPRIHKGGGARNPLITHDGKKILFQALAQQPDGRHGEGDQYYQYSPAGTHRRLTNLPVSTIRSASLSRDGRRLAVVFHPFRAPAHGKKIAVCDIPNGTVRTLNLPEGPSHLVNRAPHRAIRQEAGVMNGKPGE